MNNIFTIFFAALLAVVAAHNVQAAEINLLNATYDTTRHLYTKVSGFKNRVNILINI